MINFFVSRKEYDGLVKYNSNWMKNNWMKMQRRWNLSGVIITANRQQLKDVMKFIEQNR